MKLTSAKLRPRSFESTSLCFVEAPMGRLCTLSCSINLSDKDRPVPSYLKHGQYQLDVYNFNISQASLPIDGGCHENQIGPKQGFYKW